MCAAENPLSVSRDGHTYRCGPNIGRKYHDGAQLVVALGYEFVPGVYPTLQERTLQEVRQLVALIRELERVAPGPTPE